jgi:cytochrome c
MKLKYALAAASIMAVGFAGTASAEVDAKAAQALAKAEKCTKCHDAEKDKKGPSFKSVAAKYKGKADAEAALVKFLSTGPNDHAAVSKGDAAATKTMAAWILSH